MASTKIYPRENPPVHKTKGGLFLQWHLIAFVLNRTHTCSYQHEIKLLCTQFASCRMTVKLKPLEMSYQARCPLKLKTAKSRNKDV